MRRCFARFPGAGLRSWRRPAGELPRSPGARPSFPLCGTWTVPRISSACRKRCARALCQQQAEPAPGTSPVHLEIAAVYREYLGNPGLFRDQYERGVGEIHSLVAREQLIELRHIFNRKGFQTQCAATDKSEQRVPPGLTEKVAGLRDYGPGAYQFRRVRFEDRSEEHTSELQSHSDLVCRLLLEKKKKDKTKPARAR